MRKRILNKLHDSRGMTLVEMILVMAILSVVMMAVMSLYIPVHQSTVVQTQVSDVQSNLRLATKTMSRDLLLAGFLVPIDPVIFEATATPAWTVDNPDPKDFTIRTRIVGNDFARVAAVPASLSSVIVANADMADNFPDGSLVRLFEPVMGSEVPGDPDELKRVYRVDSTVKNADGTATFSISTPYGNDPTLSEIKGETVIVRVASNTQFGTQTIRYFFEDGALIRQINGVKQILARNVDAASSGFLYGTSNGRINRVDITLSGKTKALKNNAVLGEKTREIKTSVKLRNIS